MNEETTPYQRAQSAINKTVNASPTEKQIYTLGKLGVAPEVILKLTKREAWQLINDAYSGNKSASAGKQQRGGVDLFE